MAHLSIICLGNLVADIVVRPVDRLPHAGRLAEVEQISLRAGGCATNTATWLASLGAQVSVTGQVGQDPFGDFLLAVLGARGIEHGGVLRSAAAPTSASVVLVETSGERSFLHVPGAGGMLTADQLASPALFGADALHVAGALALPGLDGDPLATLLGEARRRGLTTSLDTVWDPTQRWDRVEPSLAHLDMFFANMQEAEAITGRAAPEPAADWLRSRGAGEIALKLGQEGCYVAGTEFRGRVSSQPVASIDGTGAGDAFVAAYLFARRAGWPMATAARFANAAGAFATTTIGASEVTVGAEQLVAIAGLPAPPG